jgi:3-oxoacyl-[acyl-carrier-protein] synthase II
MRKRVAITGTGVISSLGDSAAALHAALCAGKTGLRRIEGDEFARLGCRYGGGIPQFKAEEYLQGKPLRPLDRSGQLAASVAKLALEDSGWSAEALSQHEVGLVLGTMFGSVHTISKFDRHALVAGPTAASPLDFANTVINAAAGQAAIWNKLRGVNSTIACGSTSGLMALGYAADMIRDGMQTAVLAGGVDELCFESFCGFEQAGMLCTTADGQEFPVPFGARRRGFALGEAASLLVLEEWESATARGAHIKGEILGHGNAYNPQPGDHHRSAQAIARVMCAAAADARLSFTQIDCISAAANGSLEADKHEACAILATFSGNRAKVPITAIKSMLGETLGSAGALQAVAMVEGIQDGVLPGIAGLQQVEAEFEALNFCRETYHRRMNSGLINSVGLDGNVCALLVAAPRAELNCL